MADETKVAAIADNAYLKLFQRVGGPILAALVMIMLNDIRDNQKDMRIELAALTVSKTLAESQLTERRAANDQRFASIERRVDNIEARINDQPAPRRKPLNREGLNLAIPPEQRLARIAVRF